MPRQSLSVILRGWHPLVTNQTEKSAIAVYWETASRSDPGSWCHPLASPFQGSLQRCQCIGCSAWPTVIVTWLPFTFHFKQFTCTGHPFTCAPAPLAPHTLHYASPSVGEKSHIIGSSSKYIHASAAALNLRNGPNLNTEFRISEPFGRYAQETPPKTRK